MTRVFDLLRRGKKDRPGLGASVVAKRAGAGKIPVDCFGVQIAPGGVTQRFLAGDRPEKLNGSILYWAHPGPYTIEFAPCSSAPEVGARLLVGIDFERIDVLSERFAQFLGRLDLAEVNLETLESEVRRCTGPYLFPTAATAEELESVRARLSNTLRAAVGFSCLRLERLDFGLANKHPDQNQRLLGIHRAAIPHRVVGRFSLARAGLQQSAFLGFLYRWHANRRTARRQRELDAGLRRRLFLELPRICTYLSTNVEPENERESQRYRDALGRLERVAARVNFLPSLDSSLSDRQISPAQLVQGISEIARAGVTVDQLWEAIGSLPLASNERYGAWMGEVERLVANLEGAIQGRKSLGHLEGD